MSAEAEQGSYGNARNDALSPVVGCWPILQDVVALPAAAVRDLLDVLNVRNAISHRTEKSGQQKCRPPTAEVWKMVSTIHGASVPPMDGTLSKGQPPTPIRGWEPLRDGLGCARPVAGLAEAQRKAERGEAAQARGHQVAIAATESTRPRGSGPSGSEPIDRPPGDRCPIAYATRNAMSTIAKSLFVH